MRTQIRPGHKTVSTSETFGTGPREHADAAWDRGELVWDGDILVHIRPR